MSTPDAAASVFGERLPLAESYAAILAGRAVEWGLIGPRESARVWDRHILNSVAVAAEIGPDARVIDVGSGAGLPGIPLALARPDLNVTLLEPLLRRANFLTLAVEELGLEDRVTVVRARAEDHRGRYDVVTCRAVAPLPRLVGWTRHLFVPSGLLVALKGESAVREVADAASELRRANLRGRVEQVQVVPDADPTYLLVVESS